MISSNSGKYVEKLGSHTSLLEMLYASNTLELLAAPSLLKAKHTPTIGRNGYAPESLSKRNIFIQNPAQESP